MITGMDRLTAAINGSKSDRIPVFTILLDQGAKELGMSIEEYYKSGENVARGQLALREKYGYDNVWSLFYVGKEAELLGCKKILYAKDGPPNVGDMIIKNHDDIRNLQVPDDIFSHPAFQETRKCIDILKSEVGGKYPICSYLTGSMTMPALLMGMEKWFELCFMGPFDLRDMLLQKCSDFFKKQLLAYQKAGADIFVYSNPFGSTDFVSQTQLAQLSMPWMQKDLEGMDTSAVVYYCGGARVEHSVETVIEKLGLKAFYLGGFDNIAKVKQIINGRALTCAVINDILLLDWSPQQVKQEVKKIIDAGMSDGRFLFGTLLMPYNIPDENIRAMLEAAYEYGTFR